MPNNNKKSNRPKKPVSNKVVKPVKRTAKKPAKKKVVDPVETTKPTDLVEKWAPVVAEEATQEVDRWDKQEFVPTEEKLGWFKRVKRFLSDLARDLT